MEGSGYLQAPTQLSVREGLGVGHRRYGRGGEEKIPAFVGVEPRLSASSQSLYCPSYHESYSVKFKESNV
jgi:hypothetical protein